jgi:hypothetical protein
MRHSVRQPGSIKMRIFFPLKSLRWRIGDFASTEEGAVLSPGGRNKTLLFRARTRIGNQLSVTGAPRGRNGLRLPVRYCCFLKMYPSGAGLPTADLVELPLGQLDVLFLAGFEQVASGTPRLRYGCSNGLRCWMERQDSSRTNLRSSPTVAAQEDSLFHHRRRRKRYRVLGGLQQLGKSLQPIETK